MEALKEITAWSDGTTANHTYLLDGNKLVAYIKKGDTEPFYFKSPIKGFSKTGRKFEVLKKNPFTVAVKSDLRKVQGSKGNSYFVDDQSHTCTCPGFQFRGSCKHFGVEQ